MNPFGLLDVLVGVVDSIGQAVGRKPRQKSRRDRIWFGLLYGFLMGAGVALIIWMIRSS